MKKKLLTAIGLMISGLFITTGCATKAVYKEYGTLYAQGKYRDASDVMYKSIDEKAEKLEEKVGTGKYFLEELDIANAELADGNYADAVAIFAKAEDSLEIRMNASAVGKGLSQVGATLTNDNSLPYPIRDYDQLMMGAFKTISTLGANKPEDAVAEIVRLNDRAKLIVEANEKAILEKQDEIAEKDEDENNAAAREAVMKAIEDKDNVEKLNSYKALADQWEPYSDFISPYIPYLEGLVYLFTGSSPSDFENASFAFRKAQGMSGANVIGKAIEIADENSSASRDSSVFVIFENGLSFEKDEYSLDFVIPYTVGGVVQMVYAGIALPKLVERPSAYSAFDIYDGNKKLGKTEEICNIDRVIGSEFKRELPSIITRNVISAGIKSTVNAMVSAAVAKKNPNAGALMSLAGSALQKATTHADTRIWNSIPKNIHAAIIPKPANGKLSFCVEGTTTSILDVEIASNGPALVYIRVPSAGIRPTCFVFPSVK